MPAKSLSSVTVCGGFAFRFSAHVFALRCISSSKSRVRSALFSPQAPVQIIPVQTLVCATAARPKHLLDGHIAACGHKPVMSFRATGHTAQRS